MTAPQEAGARPPSNRLKFFIDGEWMAPVVPATLDVMDLSTE